MQDQAIQYVVWFDDIKNAYGGEEPEDKIVFVNLWCELLKKPCAEEKIGSFTKQYHAVQQALAFANYIPEEEGEIVRQDELVSLPWQELCTATGQQSGLRDLHDEIETDAAKFAGIDWSETELLYNVNDIPEMQTWLRRISVGALEPEFKSNDAIKLDDGSLEQLRAIKIIDNNLINGKQTLLLLLGAAGTGKTWIISFIKNKFKKQVSVAATTGRAAWNIGGKTIHSLVGLPLSTQYRPLKSQKLKRLQQNFEGVKLVFIDECSVLSRSQLGFLHRNLCAIKGNDQWFGGLSIVLAGDFHQLHPVASYAMFLEPNPTDEHGVNGYAAYGAFKEVVIVTKSQRQKDAQQFQCLLTAIRNNAVTEKMYDIFKTRCRGMVSNLHEFVDATQLAHTRYAGSLVNLNKLKALGKRFARIDAKHSSPAAAKIDPSDIWGLEKSL